MIEFSSSSISFNTVGQLALASGLYILGEVFENNGYENEQRDTERSDSYSRGFSYANETMIETKFICKSSITLVNYAINDDTGEKTSKNNAHAFD